MLCYMWSELKPPAAQVAELRFRFIVLLLEPHPLENTLLFSRKTLTYSGHGASAYHCKVPVCGALPAADRYTVRDLVLELGSSDWRTRPVGLPRIQGAEYQKCRFPGGRKHHPEA